MFIHPHITKDLVTLYGTGGTINILHLAKKQEKLEAKHRRKMEALINELTERAIDGLADRGRIPAEEIERRVYELLVDQSFETMLDGMSSVARIPGPRLAARPRTIRDLMDLWDLWRKKKVRPKRQAKIAAKWKNEYIKKIQSVWERYSEDFRKGDEFTQKQVKERIRIEADTTHARANTIVGTETTRYYNQGRRTVYDASPDVSHYLFVAIRDSRTTHWCGGGRDRDNPANSYDPRNGAVFTKGTELLRRNTPPTHWNCRSEILPLTAANPEHRRIIADHSRRAENRNLAPLPKGWNK